MMYAIKDGERITAEPGLHAHCPLCGGDVIAKCGSIKIWHWSHIKADCDPWTEPETAWHRAWKELFPPHCREVAIGNHRADVMTDSGVVIEFQHSTISAETIKEREDFYGEKMIWVVDATNFDLDLFNNKMRWYHPRKSWTLSNQPILFHRLTELGHRFEQEKVSVSADYERCMRLRTYYLRFNTQEEIDRELAELWDTEQAIWRKIKLRSINVKDKLNVVKRALEELRLNAYTGHINAESLWKNEMLEVNLNARNMRGYHEIKSTLTLDNFIDRYVLKK